EIQLINRLILGWELPSHPRLYRKTLLQPCSRKRIPFPFSRPEIDPGEERIHFPLSRSQRTTDFLTKDKEREIKVDACKEEEESRTTTTTFNNSSQRDKERGRP